MSKHAFISHSLELQFCLSNRTMMETTCDPHSRNANFNSFSIEMCVLFPISSSSSCDSITPVVTNDHFNSGLQMFSPSDEMHHRFNGCDEKKKSFCRPEYSLLQISTLYSWICWGYKLKAWWESNECTYFGYAKCSLMHDNNEKRHKVKFGRSIKSRWIAFIWLP